MANASALTLLDPLWPAAYSASVAKTRTVGGSLLMIVAGATVRPRSVGALVAGSAALWLLLHVLAWADVFDVFAVFAPKPVVWFQF